MTEQQAEKYSKQLREKLIGMVRRIEHTLTTPKILEELKREETVIIFNRLSDVLTELDSH